MIRALVTVSALLIGWSVSAQITPEQRKSGADFMSPSTRAMQDDDTSNPGMLAALEGESIWKTPAGSENKSCTSCHGAAENSMKGAAAGYPAYHEATARPINLEGRVNLCRQDRQKASPLRAESKELLALTTYVALQSRGMPVTPSTDERLTSFRQQGESLWSQRFGQLNFSCAQCHDDNWGRRLGSAPIPQAHPNGYPVYRLEWQGMGSLQRRFRNCMSGVRAEPFALGAPEFIALELFLMTRAVGMPMETPSVRP
jgi:sulfur-oxidizing protein SoxA